MIHEKYSGKIKNYVDGIARDLENVTANPGHDLVKDSILEQSRRLADHAVHDQKFMIELFDEFLTMLEKRHTIVDSREHDCWKYIPHEQVMDEFKTYLTWGLDAVNHFDEDANIYEASDVKKFVDAWFVKAKEKENKTQEKSEEELDKE